jgi:putative copper resistance protein D
VHDVEHLVYLSTGLLFWWPVVGLDPSPWRMAHPVRLLYVFLAGPVNTFTALAIYSATEVLYPHYTQVPRSWGPSPLTDQHWGGALMWIVGDLMLLTAVVAVALAWMRHDMMEAARIDARLDAEAAREARRGAG